MNAWCWFRVFWLCVLTSVCAWQAVYYTATGYVAVGMWNVIGAVICANLWRGYRGELWTWGGR